jgi:hypothetical protein
MSVLAPLAVTRTDKLYIEGFKHLFRKEGIHGHLLTEK